MTFSVKIDTGGNEISKRLVKGIIMDALETAPQTKDCVVEIIDDDITFETVNSNTLEAFTENLTNLLGKSVYLLEKSKEIMKVSAEDYKPENQDDKKA